MNKDFVWPPWMTTRERLMSVHDDTWRTVKEWADLIGRSVSTTRWVLKDLAFYQGEHPPMVMRYRGHNAFEYKFTAGWLA